MPAIQETDKRALRQRRRKIAKLHEAIEAQVTHAIELVGLEPRTTDALSKDRERPRREPLQHRQAKHRGIGADFRVEVRANPPERVVQGERIEIAAALIQQIAGHRGEARSILGIGCGAERHEREHADDRHLPVLDRQHTHAVAERAPPDLRKLKTRLGAENRKAGAVCRHHDTDTGCESASAISARPRGTRLNATQLRVSHCRAAVWSDPNDASR